MKIADLLILREFLSTLYPKHMRDLWEGDIYLCNYD